MRARVTLHNLGEGVLDAKLEHIQRSLLREIQSRDDSAVFARRVLTDHQDAQFKLGLLKQHDNMLEIMRQNVYIIELLRELLNDTEPKYDPRRWYDHGWR